MSFTLWFTGLPSSGKSTIAKRVEERLSKKEIELHNLDGDNLRKKLHPDLGFSKEERKINNQRMGVIASLLNHHNIGVIVAAVSSFREGREIARDMVEEEGDFFQIFVDCPVEVCKERDPKGLYEKAENGEIPNFTGINHPYERPGDPDVYINTAEMSVEECVDRVMKALDEKEIAETREPYTGLSESDEKKIKSRLEDLGYL